MADEILTESTETTTTPDSQTSGADGPSKPFHELGRTERKAFLTKGDNPKPKEQDDDADPSPAPSGEQAVATGDVKHAADSEPAKPEKKVKKPVDPRYEEILADRHRERETADRERKRADSLERRLAELEKPKPDALKDSSPSADATEPGWKKYLKMPGAPKAADFAGDLDEYSAAMSVFVAEQVAKETFEGQFSEKAKASEAEAASVKAIESAITQSETRINAEKAADPKIAERIHEKFKALTPARFIPDGQPVGPHHFAKDLIMFESEHPLNLSAFYSTDEGIAEFQQLMTLDAEAIRRAIAYRDVSFRGKSSPVKGSPKPFTKTPDPSPKVEKRSGAVTNGAEAAVNSGDFRAFMREMDAQEGVTSRGRR